MTAHKGDTQTHWDTQTRIGAHKHALGHTNAHWGTQMTFGHTNDSPGTQIRAHKPGGSKGFAQGPA